MLQTLSQSVMSQTSDMKTMRLSDLVARAVATWMSRWKLGSKVRISGL